MTKEGGMTDINNVKTLTDLQGKAAITDEKAEAKGKGIGFYPEVTTLITQHGFLGDRYMGMVVGEAKVVFFHEQNIDAGVELAAMGDKKEPYYSAPKDEHNPTLKHSWRAFVPAAAVLFGEYSYDNIGGKKSSVRFELGLRDGDPRLSGTPPLASSAIKYYLLNETQWSLGGRWNHVFNEHWDTSFKAYYNLHTDVNSDLNFTPGGPTFVNDIRSMDYMLAVNANYAGHKFSIQPQLSPTWSKDQDTVWRKGIGAVSKFQISEDLLYFGLRGSAYNAGEVNGYNIISDAEIKFKDEWLTINPFVGYGTIDASKSRLGAYKEEKFTRENMAFELGTKLAIDRGAAWLVCSSIWPKVGSTGASTGHEIYCGVGFDLLAWAKK